MAQQLTFDLAVRPSLGRGDFFESAANHLALVRLDSPGTWPNGKLVLTGPKGAGKTHLVHVWAEQEAARLVSVADLAQLDIGSIDTAVAVDDADQLSAEGETALFHLHNHLATQSRHLLLTARAAPSRWSITLPDLRSRMEAAEVIGIDPPDDALLSAVLMKLFADRQIDVTPATIAWLTTHMDRSFGEAQRIVALLDARALAEHRKVTRDFTQEVLDKDL